MTRYFRGRLGVDLAAAQVPIRDYNGQLWRSGGSKGPHKGAGGNIAAGAKGKGGGGKGAGPKGGKGKDKGGGDITAARGRDPYPSKGPPKGKGKDPSPSGGKGKGKDKSGPSQGPKGKGKGKHSK